MATKQILKKKEVSLPVAIGIGLGVSILITLIGISVLAYLISNESLPENGVGPGGIVIHLMSAAAGGFAAYGAHKQRRVMICGLAAGCYLVVMLGMTALFFDGQYQGIGAGTLAVLGGGVLAVLPGFIGSTSGGKRPKFKAFR